MAITDAELEKQLKDAGKQLLHPSDSVDELLLVLDNVEKLLLKVDQSPKKSMIDALKPSMNELIKDSLSKHSDIDVKVAVASCISEITRITAPDAPYTDDQMRDIFQLIVSSFENLADQSSRSYHKRALILETVSKVRSCVIMLDLECDELIVKMFEHFLKSVRDFHLDSVFISMENIMVLVIEESEEISVELLKPLLACVKKDREGVLPVAHKIAKGVLLKSADKLKPYVIPALKTLGESLDMYDTVVAAVCEGTTASFNNNDDNDSGLQLSNECKVEKGSVDEAQQADEIKLTTASSDHMNEAVKEEVDPTVENTSLKSVMSNGVNVTVKEEASVSKKPEEDKSQEPLTKEDTDDSDMLVKQNSETEKTSEQSEKKVDINTVVNSAEPSSDSYQVEGDKEIKKDNNVNEREIDNALKELENEIEKENNVKESETEKDKDAVHELSLKAAESTPTVADVSSPSQKKPVPQEDETASPSKSGPPHDETHVKKVDLPENKGLTQEDIPEAPKEAGKKSIVSKEVKHSDIVNKYEDGKASSDSDAKPLKKSSKSTKQKCVDTVNKSEDDASSDSDAKLLKKTSKLTKQKLVDTVNKSEDDASSDSDAKPLKKLSKSAKQLGKKSEQSGKKSDVRESDSKKPKPSGKKLDAKGEESDSDAKPLKTSVTKGDKSKIAVEEARGHESEQSGKKSDVRESDSKKPKPSGKKLDAKGEESDSDAKPLKTSVTKGDKSKIAVEEARGHESEQSGKKSDVRESDSKKPKPSGKKLDAKGEESDSDAKPPKTSVTKGDKSKIAVEEARGHDSDSKPLKQSAKKSTSKKKDDGKKPGAGKNVAEKDQAKALSGVDEMDVSPKSATKSAKGVENSTETLATSVKRKRSAGKDQDARKYDESLVGTKVKVWWPEDKAYYEGVVTEYYPAKKKHKILYVDGDEEQLNLKTQRWKILQEVSVRDNEEQNTEALGEEASPAMHKKKKSKTDPAVSQEKIKDSAKRVGVSSSSKSKGSTPKDNKSTPKTSGKSSDAAATTSNDTGKSKEDLETPKTGSKTKTVNNSKGKTPPSGSKSNTKVNTKEPEDVKSTENIKGGSKSVNKRKKRI